jgi:hypothetical protein
MGSQKSAIGVRNNATVLAEIVRLHDQDIVLLEMKDAGSKRTVVSRHLATVAEHVDWSTELNLCRAGVEKVNNADPGR